MTQTLPGIQIRDRLKDGKDQEDGLVKTNFRAVQRSFGFWAIIVGLGIMLLLAALEK